MQLNITVDCTPAEARAFLGLPDVTPLHDAWLEQAKSLMRNGLQPEDLQRMTRAWTAGMPGMADGLEKMQQLFWQAAAGGAKPPHA